MRSELRSPTCSGRVRAGFCAPLFLQIKNARLQFVPFHAGLACFFLSPTPPRCRTCQPSNLITAGSLAARLAGKAAGGVARHESVCRCARAPHRCAKACSVASLASCPCFYSSVAAASYEPPTVTVKASFSSHQGLTV